MSKRQEGSENSVVQAYLNEVKNWSLLDKEEEIELAKRIEQGDEKAYKLFIESNLRLVISFAKIYSRHNKHVQFLDCIQEGNIGLMQAVRGFDWRMGYKFSTYAVDWIRQGIIKATLSDNGAIYLPNKVGESMVRLKKTENELLKILGRQPSTEEIAERMGISQEEALMLIWNMQRAKSLNEPLSNEEDAAEFGDLQLDTENQSAEDVLIRKQLAERLKQAIESLSEKERQIFLLIRNENLLATEISEILDLKPENVRQIYRGAIRKLRVAKELSPYRRLDAKKSKKSQKGKCGKK